MSVTYGQSYTDKKTQSAMMKFLRQSNKFTGNTRKGTAKPRTQLNKDAKPKNDRFDNKRLQANSKGPVKGSEYQERANEKPISLRHRAEKQKNNYKPVRPQRGRHPNISKVNRSYK